MSDVVRKVIALSILILGAGLLWAGRRSYTDPEDAKDQTKATVAAARERAASGDPRLHGSYRFETRRLGYVHLEGDPFHRLPAWLFARGNRRRVSRLSAGMMTPPSATGLFSVNAREILWPKIDPEYQQELQGIAEGLNARTGSQLDVYDIVALNSFEESFPTTTCPGSNKQEKTANAPNLKSPGNCSAFVATGSWTKDGKIVIAHNNWTTTSTGSAGASSSTFSPHTATAC